MGKGRRDLHRAPSSLSSFLFRHPACGCSVAARVMYQASRARRVRLHPDQRSSCLAVAAVRRSLGSLGSSFMRAVTEIDGIQCRTLHGRGLPPGGLLPAWLELRRRLASSPALVDCRRRAFRVSDDPRAGLVSPLGRRPGRPLPRRIDMSTSRLAWGQHEKASPVACSTTQQCLTSSPRPLPITNVKRRELHYWQLSLGHRGEGGKAAAAAASSGTA